MSRTAVRAPSIPPRQVLSDKQADTVGRLVDATVDELREHGYDGLTVRNVARRAGVAPPPPTPTSPRRTTSSPRCSGAASTAVPATAVDRTNRRERAWPQHSPRPRLLVADEPQLAAACTTAILSNEPDVRRLRDAIGPGVSDRLAAALGTRRSPEVLRTLNLVHSGALVQAGMGNFSYADLADRMDEVARVIFGGRS